MAEVLSPRIEWEIKDVIEKIAKSDLTISDTAANLIIIGLAIRESGAEPKIEGPFGVPRPFAKISFGDRMTEIRTEVEEEILDRLTSEFDHKPNTSAREAMRLGVLAVAEDQIKIVGPAGGPRPFAQISVRKIDDPELREKIAQLKKRFNS